MKRFCISTLLLPLLGIFGCQNDKPTEAPYFDCGYSAEHPILFEPHGATPDENPELRIVVQSNTGWSITSDAEAWCTVYPSTGYAEGRFYVTARVLERPYPRSCTLTVRNTDDGTLLATIPVSQSAPAKRLETEPAVSSSDDGDNLYLDVEANIDWAAELTDPDDASWVTLGEPDLEAGRLSVSVTPYDGERQAVIRIYALDEPSLECLVTLTQTDRVRLADFTTLDAVPDKTLVTLENVSFAVPLGTLYNLTLSGLECDLTIRDNKGNTFTVRTPESAEFKHARNIRACDYELTGTIDRSDAETPVLRLRSADDMVELGTQSYRPIAEWYGDQSAISNTGWSVAAGSGSCTFGVEISAPSGSSANDSKSSFARKDCTQEYSKTNTYWGPSLKSWNGSSQYYLFIVPTEGVTGEIYLSLWSLSFGSGPGELKVEWAESADAGTWTDCGVVLEQNSAASGTSNEYFLRTFSIHADGAEGHDTLCFRVSKASEKRADGSSSAISSAGPNYMCYFGVFSRNE